MGTKKGQVRKTARRAYERKKKADKKWNSILGDSIFTRREVVWANILRAGKGKKLLKWK
tara:strand:- start:16 stop:192 length:177 start_codon:yes stop_codon:yes gene_type:complete